jgi:DNA invertase Pin-like site-specific DNA recombinase
MTPPDTSAPPTGPTGGKVRVQHLTRLAVVYVRQSTPRQVQENTESTARQYDLARRAADLGWPPDRVLVIDDDLGQSGTSAAARTGFQRLLAELGLNHVGLVLGLEMSRLARSNKDWHQLLELCAVFHTLLADQDGVYDPTDHNDRLLLGLSGIMSEAELHVMRNRLDQGKRNKARRGELFFQLPPGYVRAPDGGAALDPDEQVQSAIRLVFEAFAERGSARAVADYLRARGLRLPLRANNGPRPGPLTWRPPTRRAVNNLLLNPTYAGAYTYGRAPVDPRRPRLRNGRPARVALPPDQWPVVLRDRLPAYITWDEYLRNRERLRQNAARWDTPGAVRDGPALLTGLVRCARCGYRMFVSYPGSGAGWYGCRAAEPATAAGRCHRVPTSVLDPLVAGQVLRALEPAALELSLSTFAAVERDRDRVHTDWGHRLERARYQADRAGRQFARVEPENRLVARELERQWEAALADLRRLEEEYARFCRGEPHVVSAADRAAIRRLAADVPRLWAAATTTPADRKAVIRQLVEAVRVAVAGPTERVGVSIHWVGGCVTEHEVRRPVRRYTQLEGYDRMRQLLAAGKAAGRTAPELAAELNAAGFRTPKGHSEYTAIGVRALLFRLGLTQAKPNTWAACGSDEYPRAALARRLGMSRNGVQGWIDRGWVHARATPAGWVVWADAGEFARLERLRDQQRTPYPIELTTPRPRPKEPRKPGRG